MDSFAVPGIGSSDSTRNANFSFSKLIAYGFALAIIVGLGALAVGGVGLGGYLQESLGTLTQNHAFIMMVTCFISGTGLLIIGIVGSIIHYRSNNLQHREDGIPSNDLEADTAFANETVTALLDDSTLNVTSDETSTEEDSEVHPYMKNNPKINRDVISTLDTHDGLIYGQGAWKYWGLEVIDKSKEPPKIDWNAHDPHFNEPYSKNYILLYIPEKIRVTHTGKEEAFTVASFKKNSEMVIPIGSSWTSNYEYFAAEEFKDCQAPGWVLLSTRCIPGSLENKDLDPIEGFRIPDLLEIMVLILMIKEFTGQELYSNSAVEIVKGDHSKATRTKQNGKLCTVGSGSVNFHPFSIQTPSSHTCGTGVALSLNGT